ncbi:MAG: hypothetical protein VKK63_03205 [Synechococcus sp.]|nr:hypothetical protein [Synechococcus sp.]
MAVDEAAASRVASQLSVADVKAAGAAPPLPVKFDDAQSEINFLALMHLLDFGSGYDDVLRQRTQRDAHETVQYALLGMHISGARLDYHWMKAFSAYSVASFFGFEPMDEEELMPGVMVSRPGVLHPYAQALRETVTKTGAATGNRQKGGSYTTTALFLTVATLSPSPACLASFDARGGGS